MTHSAVARAGEACFGRRRWHGRPAVPVTSAAIALFAFAVYAATAAPTVTLRHNGADSGDLVTAAVNLGVPHPTGYPVYTVLAHLFTRLPGAEPARCVTFFSAISGALAVGVMFLAACRYLVAREGEGPGTLAAAFAGAGLLASGELLWSQATVAEVYSFGLLLVAALLAAAVYAPPHARPYALALLFGVSLAHHLTIVLMVPALWPYLSTARRWLTIRKALCLVLCLTPGLLAYLYLPLRAAAQPVPNWGQADTLEGLLWLISGVAYRRYLGVAAPGYLLQRLSAWAAIWVRDLGVPGLALALVGVWRGLVTDREFTLFGLSYVALLTGYAMLYTTADSYLYLLPAAAILALWTARGARVALGALQARLRPGLRRSLAAAGMVTLLVALPLSAVAHRWPAMDLSSDRQAFRFAEAVLRAARPNAIVISNGDVQTFPLWYLRYGLMARPDVTVVDRHLLAFGWYRRQVARQDPRLARLASARDGPEALAYLVHDRREGEPVQATHLDGFLLELGAWTEDGSLFRLSEQERGVGGVGGTGRRRG